MTSGTGTCNVIVNQPGNSNYNAAPTVTKPVTAMLVSQATLTSSAIPSTINYNDTSTLSSSGGSGRGAVTYAVTSGGANCSIVGRKLTGLHAGTCEVRATKAGDADYQPISSAPITVTVTQEFTVTARGDLKVTPSPTSQQVNYNGTGTINLTVASGYMASIASDTCGGSLSGTTYTTDSVTSNCAVRFTATLQQFTVTASGDANVTPAPTSQQVSYNGTGTINLTVASGYTASIASDRCGGSLSGTTYTTGSVTSNCAVSFTSTIQQFTVTATGYTASIASDTCGGSLSGTTYTTGSVMSNCAVSFIGIAPFPASAGPLNVLAVPGNSEAVISWSAPGNTGTGTVTGYTVTFRHDVYYSGVHSNRSFLDVHGNGINEWYRL